MNPVILGRILVVIFFLIGVDSAIAEQKQLLPRVRIFKYECDQIDYKQTGFECRFNEKGFQIYWRELTKTMSPERRERAWYEFERLIFRFYELGGQQFEIANFTWPTGKHVNCSFGRGDYMYVCN